MLGLVIIAVIFSIYTIEFQYKDPTVYDYSETINNCCTINYDEESLEYSSMEELLENIPEDSGSKYIIINYNIPFFDNEDKKLKEPFIELSELDVFNRSGTAFGLLNRSLLPENERSEDLSVIKPSGFMQVNVKEKYNVSFMNEGKEYYYLYQRCHLIAYSLGGPEVDERDIFTGTFSTNMSMQTYEKAVSSFLYRYPNDNVLYRVTPVYKNNNLLCSGVLMEGYSKNHNLSFCVYIFNNEENFRLNYSNGASFYTK